MMRGMRNIATGALIGAAVSAMFFPQLDKRQQKNIRRAGRRAKGMAEGALDTMLDYMK